MNKLRTILLTILSTIIIIFSTVFVSASNITVKLNDEILKFDKDPIIMNDRVMVPMRGIFESLGYTVEWNAKTQGITAIKDNITMTLRVGSALANINGDSYALDSPTIIVDGVTMVPVRFIADNSGAIVNWDYKTNTVYISNNYGFNTSEISKSVVQINTNNTQGSGFFIGDGIIATNRHVLKNATELSITFSDYSVLYDDDVRVIGFDETSDIAIIKINELGNPYLNLGNSDNLNIDDEVIAIGSPLGKLNVITKGNVTGKLPGLIVSNAKIEQGSSGGVLLNNKGEAVGMTFSYDSGKNYFSIPINDIKNVKLNKDFTLEQYNSFENIIKPPSRFNTTSTGDLYWEPVYGADGYYIYISDTLNGSYNQVKNPNNGEYIWYWGYPKGFGVRNDGAVKIYIKIASIKNGIISNMSTAIELNKTQ